MTTNLCQAALRLTPDDGDLAPAERAATRQLLSEAMAVLPPRMIERLDRDVQVRWSDRLNHDVYGSAGGRTLLLNLRLLPALTDGRAATQRTARPHGTVRQELLATLIHELGHLYDRSRLWSATSHRQLAFCHQRASSLGKVGLPDECRGKTERRFTLSDDPRLLDLADTLRPARRTRARQRPGGTQPRRIRADQPARIRRGEPGILSSRPELRMPATIAAPILPRAFRLAASERASLRKRPADSQRRQ